MSKLSIINSVPLNAGDFALMESLLFFIERNLDNAIVDVYSDMPSFLTQSELTIHKNYYDFHKLYDATDLNFLEKVFRKFCFLFLDDAPLVQSSWFQRVKKNKYIESIKDSDFVISAPGGYLHDFYGTANRFFVFDQLLKQNLKIILLGQSIGPFWKSESVNRINKLLSDIHATVFRESISEARYKELKLTNVSICPDIAFLLSQKYEHLYKEKVNKEIKNIVVSFRSWKDDRTTEKIIEKAADWCDRLIGINDVVIHFLSTCQGREDYIDDIKIARKISKTMKRKERFEIIEGFHSPKELIKLYSDYDLYVGMRMHGSILALLGGTPAVCIGYEDKSIGLYRDLGLNDYHITYDEELEQWESVFNFVKLNYIEYAGQIRRVISNAATEIDETLNKLFDEA